MENEEESFVCKVRFKKEALDGIEVLEGNEERCRELFRNTSVGPKIEETIKEASEGG